MGSSGYLDDLDEAGLSAVKSSSSLMPSGWKLAISVILESSFYYGSKSMSPIA